MEVRRQLETDKPRVEIARAVAQVEEYLSSGDSSLVYAGYPYDPFTFPMR